jgi:hypothetical protein
MDIDTEFAAEVHRLDAEASCILPLPRLPHMVAADRILHSFAQFKVTTWEREFLQSMKRFDRLSEKQPEVRLR